VVIDWSNQIHEFLKKDSSQPILDGLNPGPLVEIEFWKTKTANLESICDQVRRKENLKNKIHSIKIYLKKLRDSKTKKMIQLLYSI